MAVTAAAAIRHSALELEVDLLARRLRGTVTHAVSLDALALGASAGGTLRLHLRGGTVQRVLVAGAPARFRVADALAAAAPRLGVAAAGLGAFAAAATAAVAAAAEGELAIELPAGLVGDRDGCVPVLVAYTLGAGAGGASSGTGALVFATDRPTGDPFAFTLLRPGSSDAWLGLGAGARCVFPCVDAPGARSTYELRIRAVGADGADVLALPPAPGAAAGAPPRRVALAVLASGDHVATLPAPPAGAAGVPAGAGAGRVHVFSISTPVPPSAVGFVVGPLAPLAPLPLPPLQPERLHPRERQRQQQLQLQHEQPQRGGGGGGATPTHHHHHTNSGGVTPAAGSRAGHAAAPTAAAAGDDVHVSHWCSPRARAPVDEHAGRAQTGGAVLGSGDDDDGSGGASAGAGAACAAVRAAHHAARARGILAFACDWLDAPFPARSLRHVFLPDSVLPCAGALAATPHGVALPSALGGNAPGSHLATGASVSAPWGGGDVHPQLGLVLYPEALLLPLGAVDPEATCVRAQAAGTLAGWLGCVLTAASWRDAWLLPGLVGYLGSAFLSRQLRGGCEAPLDMARAAEAVAQLEEQFPGMTPLWPRRHGSASGEAALTALSPQQRAYVAAKAPAVVHMLAARLGEPALQRALRLLVRHGLQLPVALAEVAAAVRLSCVELELALGDARSSRAAASTAAAAAAAAAAVAAAVAAATAAAPAPPEQPAPTSADGAARADNDDSGGGGGDGGGGSGRARRDSLALEDELLPAPRGASAAAAAAAGGGGSSGGGALLPPPAAARPAAGGRAALVAATLLALESCGGVLTTELLLAALQAGDPRLPLPLAFLPGGLDAGAPAGSSSAAAPGSGMYSPTGSTGMWSPRAAGGGATWGGAAPHAAAPPPPPLCQPLQDFADQWLADTGVPQLVVGVHVSKRDGRVELVVEQLLRPGSRVFTGDLTVHIAERTDGDEGTVGHHSHHGSSGGGGGHATAHLRSHPSVAPPPFLATPEVWSYSFALSSAREVFYPTCHTKIKRRTAAEATAASATLMADTHRKKARESGGARAARLDPLAQLAALERTAVSDVDADDVNDTPVLWLRVDPAGAWLKRLSVAAPPVMLAAQLVREESVGGRVEALVGLAGAHAPSSLFAPGLNGFDVGDHRSAPYVWWESTSRDTPEVRASLRRDVAASIIHTGYSLRPRRRLYAACRMLAVCLDVDPTHAGTGRPQDALAAAVGGGGGAAAAPPASAMAATKATGGGPLPATGHPALPNLARAAAGAGSGGGPAAGHPPPPARRPDVPVGFNSRVRCAAANALASWATSRLPPSSSSSSSAAAAGGRSEAALLSPEAVEPEHYETCGGLAACLMLMKHLFFAPGDVASVGWSLLEPEATSVLHDPRVALPLLEGYAAAGQPVARPPNTLAEHELRRAAVVAFAGVRHADGVTPLPVLALLTRLLRGYEGGGGGGGSSAPPPPLLDETPLAAALVLGLASAAVDAVDDNDPDAVAVPTPVAARRRALLADAHTALREAFALHVAALRQQQPGAGGLPWSLAGTTAAACITALALVESTRRCPPLTVPLLRNFVGAAHPVDGAPLPPRVRLAAFVALARVLLVQPHGTRDTPAARAELAGAAAALVALATAPLCAAAGGVGGLDPWEAALAEASLTALHLLHHRSDELLVETYVETGALPPGCDKLSDALPTRDPLALADLRAGLHRAFMPPPPAALSGAKRARDDGDGGDAGEGGDDDDGGGGGGGGVGASALVAPPPPLGLHWQSDDLLVDSGLLDACQPVERLQLYERRLYGAARAGASSLGPLRHLADAALASAPPGDEARVHAASVVASLWRALAACATRPSPWSATAALTAFHLIHGVYGLLPPAPTRMGPAALPGDAAALLAQLAPLVAAEMDARLERLRHRRETLRERHVHVCQLLARAREIHEATSFLMAADDEDEAAGGGAEGASGAGAGAGEDGEGGVQPSGGGGGGGVEDDDVVVISDGEGRGRRGSARGGAAGGAASDHDDGNVEVI